MKKASRLVIFHICLYMQSLFLYQFDPSTSYLLDISTNDLSSVLMLVFFILAQYLCFSFFTLF